MTNKLDFILQHLPRSGSTWLSKLLTENSNACVLPETNFIFYILGGSKYNYEELIRLDSKFKDLNIDENYFNKIKNEKDKFRIIDQICESAARKIYKEKEIIIGLKKTNLKFTNLLIKNKRVKFILLIRDIRDIYLSILHANKNRNRFEISIIKNIYEWNMQCFLFDKIDTKQVVIIRYEDLILQKDQELKKIYKLLKLNSIENSKNFFLPKKYNDIHKNIKFDSISKNSKKYINSLSSVKNFIFVICCYHYLVKYNYTNKNFIFKIINFPLHFTFKIISKIKFN